MERSILVMVSSTHAHILNEPMCEVSVYEAKKQMERVLKYIPTLKVFRDVDWHVEAYEVPAHLKQSKYSFVFAYFHRRLSVDGYKVV